MTFDAATFDMLKTGIWETLFMTFTSSFFARINGICHIRKNFSLTIDRNDFSRFYIIDSGNDGTHSRNLTNLI